MDKDKVVEYLKRKNKRLNDSLVPGFISDRTLKYLPLYVIEYCAINEEVQKVIMELTDNQLKVVSKIIKYAEKNNQDWIPLCADFIHLVQNERYTSLVADLENNEIDDALISSFIFLTNNYGNFFDINSIEDLKRVDEIRKQKVYRTKETFDPNIILLAKYGMSYDKIYNIFKRYCKDVDKLPDSEEKSFLIDIKNIIEGKGTENRIYTNMDLINNLDSRLRNFFAQIYNQRLYRLDDKNIISSVEKDGMSIPVYDAGVDFTMAIYSYGLASNLQVPNNYKDDWLRPEVSEDYMCNSIVTSANIKTAIKHCVYGFSSFEDNDLALLGSNDLGTGGLKNKANVTNPYHTKNLIADVEFRLPDELIKNTRFTNNEVYRKRRRFVNGELQKVVPDYIIYFKTTDDYENDSIWKETVNAAHDFEVPIVMVDCEKCLVHNLRKLDRLMIAFENRHDDIKSISDIIELLFSLKTGYHFSKELSEKYLNYQNQMMIVSRITNHIVEIAESSPAISIQCIDEFLNSLDDEHKKILKSPYWVKQTYGSVDNVSKPVDIITYLENLKVEIQQRLNDTYNIINGISNSI